jgi:acyl carrier protein
LADVFFKPAKAPEEVGVDSLTTTEISVNIDEHCGVILKPASLWDCPNLRAVAAHVAKTRRGIWC